MYQIAYLGWYFQEYLFNFIEIDFLLMWKNLFL